MHQIPSVSQNTGSRSEKECAVEVEQRLIHARQASAKRLRRIRTPSLLVGTFLIFLASLFRFLATPPVSAIPKEFSGLTTLLGGLGSVSMLLALVPTQRRSIWFATLACLIFSLGVFGMAIFVQFIDILEDPRSRLPIMEGLRRDLPEPPEWYVRTFTVLFPLARVPILAFAGGCARLLWERPPPRRHLKALWTTIALAQFCLCVHFCVEGIILAAAGYASPSAYLLHLWDGASLGLTAALLAWPGIRVRMQAWLAGQDSSTNVAAAVGALICARPLEELLPMAKERFRCVALDRVTKAAMAKRDPDRTLATFSEPATLGTVDAFVSHSWSDDPDAKWDALQAWRSEFWAANGREPRVWIDKFCIDQDNITESLAGLPVFLAGCDTFMVLRGETYETRLWCLLELFTFIVMDCAQQSIEVRPLGDSDASFDSFDANSATCFNPADTSHLLGIIETGLGTIDTFNTAVREIVGKRCMARRSTRSSKSSGADLLVRVCHAEPGDGGIVDGGPASSPSTAADPTDCCEDDDMFSI